MLDILKKLNEISILDVFDPEFNIYGCVIKNLNTDEIVMAANNIPMTDENCIYHASQPEFEVLSIAGKIRNNCFGQSECQVGYCYGHNRFLNSMEWHTCSEINIAASDAVLILAKRSDMDAGYQLNSSLCKGFYIPKGTAVEVYSDTLHFCPCQTAETGFRMVVGLISGTNTVLDFASDDKKLRAKNKWMITHRENTKALLGGAFSGIYGINYEIHF